MLESLRDKVLAGEDITKDEALELINLEEDRTMELLAAANRIKNKFNDKKVDLCSIINAKAGSCSEDCTFCAQSAHYDTKVNSYLLLSKEEILSRAKEMEKEGADHFGIVTTGKGVITNQDFDNILETIVTIKEETDLEVCAALGTLDRSQVERLVEVGLKRYNHNLETSENHFPNICTTHTYQERIQTVKFLKEMGISTCCGGIMGLGENVEDRIDLAFTLKELDVDAVPVNILNPIEGTPLENLPVLSPMEALKIVAVFRFILPDKIIKLCGGRENVLGDLQALSLLSGVNGLLVGNYLTTKGRVVTEDIKMIEDLGLVSSR
jgi:biotin synthase